MSHQNIGRKAAQRAAQTAPPQPAPASAAPRDLNNPEGVEILLAKRRQKFADEAVKLPPPNRAAMFGELKHPHLPGVITGWIEINEARALDWLDHNKDNRKLNKTKISSLARQHLNGDFVTTHQGVAFDDQDNLIDGQHTLKMILLTGKPVTRMVTFGLPKKPAGKNFNTMDVIDAGARSMADQLKISHGITESGPKKQICIALASLCFGTRTRSPGIGQVLEILKAFGPSIEFMLEHRAKETGLRQVGVLAGFAFAHAATSLADKGSVQHRVEQLFTELNTGDGLIDEAEFKKRQKAGKAMRPIELLRYFLTSPESLLFSKSMNRAIADVTLQVIYGEIHKAQATELTQAEIGVKWFAAKQTARVEKIASLFRIPEKK